MCSSKSNSYEYSSESMNIPKQQSRSSNHQMQWQISTTEDWDNGSKSDHGDGNWGVETFTDNPSIKKDELVLANHYGDAFTHSDYDGTTWKWQKWSETGTAYSSITNNGLYHSVGGPSIGDNTTFPPRSIIKS